MISGQNEKLLTTVNNRLVTKTFKTVIVARMLNDGRSRITLLVELRHKEIENVLLCAGKLLNNIFFRRIDLV